MSTRPRSAEPIELLGIAREHEHEHPGPTLDLGLSLSTTKAHGLIAYWRLRRSPRSTPDAASGDDTGEASVAGALAFAKAIAALHRHSDLLPARLGTGFTSAAALRRHLDEEHPIYRDALARIRGCTEIALRIDLKASELNRDTEGANPDLGASSTGAGRGRAYLLARRAEERRRQALKDAAAELAGELQEALRGLVREQRAELVDDRAGKEAVAVALLVDRAQLISLRSALSDWLERGDHRGIADGPLAPYSFAQAAQAAPPPR